MPTTSNLAQPRMANRSAGGPTATAISIPMTSQTFGAANSRTSHRTDHHQRSLVLSERRQRLGIRGKYTIPLPARSIFRTGNWAERSIMIFSSGSVTSIAAKSALVIVEKHRCFSGEIWYKHYGRRPVFRLSER